MCKKRPQAQPLLTCSDRVEDDLAIMIEGNLACGSRSIQGLAHQVHLSLRFGWKVLFSGRRYCRPR